VTLRANSARRQPDARLRKHWRKSLDLDAGEIALLLGFDEPSSFERAFHAWEGAPPSR
jgi:AraC-like DNA-binding protein